MAEFRTVEDSPQLAAGSFNSTFWFENITRLGSTQDSLRIWGRSVKKDNALLTKTGHALMLKITLSSSDSMASNDNTL